MTMAPPSRISSRPPPPSRVALAMPTEAQKNIAPIIVISAVEGWGKTSALAHAPDAAVLMAPGETGYLTLYGAGRVPAVPSASITTWTDLLATIDGFIADGAPKTLGLDALGGFERLCHDHICRTEFNGDWGEKGFSSYMRGYEVSVSEWVKLLAKLERLRNTHGTTIVLLSHVKIKTFKNPQGSDFDRYTSDVHDKTWAATAKLADAVLFGNFFTVLQDATKKKTKAIGGADRVIYTERRDAYDAKNRFGMPDVIDIPADPTQIWSTIWSNIKH